jgi:hypothetical protein
VVPLTASDMTLTVYASDGTSWRQLTEGALSGYFGAHRCLCPATLSPVLSLTESGQTNLGNSTVSVNFLLGANCLSTPASCVSLGQLAFTASQAADSPQFDSSLVFQAMTSTTVNCASLTGGSTTLWAVVAQDGVTLSFAPTIALSVSTATVPAPTAVTALAADKGILVTWTPPADTSLVAGYQVLCLPRPAEAAIASYETCGLAPVSADTTILTPADISQVCHAYVSVTDKASVRLSGLVNGTTYTVAVIAIDPSGGVSALSPTDVATPGPTTGFYDNYKQAGGAAKGCAVSPFPQHHHAELLWIAIAAALVTARGLRGRRNRRGQAAGRLLSVILVLSFSAPASAQIPSGKGSDDWAMNPEAREDSDLPPDWGLDVGISLYRPAVDSEFDGTAHPYADAFGTSRHLMSVLGVDRYLGHGIGSWGVGMRIAYQKVTGTAFMLDGSRSGDETSLRLVPLSLSAFYKADGLPGLRLVPLVPYAKAGLNGVMWTESTTGGKASHSGFTLGWHVAAGLALGLNTLGLGSIKQGAIAGAGALFFEWNHATINGLGLSGKMHVGDSTWIAGLMFDL